MNGREHSLGSRHRGFGLRGALVALVLLCVVGGTGAAYWHRDSVAASTYKTAAVERGDLLVSISATGTIEPEEVVDVGAQVAGQILAFGKDVDGKPVDYRSFVEEGTVLARIDESLCAAEVTQAEAQVLAAEGGLKRAEADLLQAKAKLRQAERDWNRAEQLGSSRALAAADYDTFKSAREVAEANVAVCEASLVQAKGSLAQAQGVLDRAHRNLGYCTIKSPVKGVIIDRRVNIGQTVVASLNAPSLFLIAKDLTRMQVWVAVNEADIGRLHPDQPVTFTVDAFPGETFKGSVNKIRLNASMTQNVVTYTVEIRTDNPGGRLLPYLTANVRFELNRRKHVLMVPNAALSWTPKTEQVDPGARKVAAETAARVSEQQAAAASTSQPASEQDARNGVGLVWVANGLFVRPIVVHVGLTDDVMTEIEGEGITEGLAVVTGEEEQTSGGSDTTNPFMPKLPKKRAGSGGPPPPP